MNKFHGKSSKSNKEEKEKGKIKNFESHRMLFNLAADAAGGVERCRVGGGICRNEERRRKEEGERG
jgi:hypothetical protein